MKRVHIFDQRYYRVDDKFYPSVTTVLSCLAKTGLVEWYKNVGIQSNEIMDVKAKKGSYIHSVIDEVITHKATVILNDEDSPLYTPSELMALHSKSYIVAMTNTDDYLQEVRALKFLAELPIKSLRTETNYVSDTYGVGGTIDIMFELKEDYNLVVNRTKANMKKGWYILDWKTGKANKEQPIQLGIYSAMVQEEIQGAIVFFTNADTKSKIAINYIDREELDYNIQLFQDIKVVFDKHFRTPDPVLQEFNPVTEYMLGDFDGN